MIAPTGYYIFVPLLLSPSEDLGYPEDRDLADEIATIKALRTSRTSVTYQEGPTNYTCVVEDYDWRPAGKSNFQAGQSGALFGTFMVKLKVIAG